jgi:hypothetical protein
MQNYHLEEVYITGYNSVSSRLNSVWETKFASQSSNPESEQLKSKFFSSVSPEFDQKYNSAGDAYALVRFEKVFTNHLQTFNLLSFNEVFEQAKAEFICGWKNHSNLPLIECYFAQPVETIVSELGQYKAWCDYGFESLREISVSFPFYDDSFEDDIEFEMVTTNEQPSFHGNDTILSPSKKSKTIKETAFEAILKKNKRLTSFYWKAEDWKVLMALHKHLRDANYISSISFKEFELHFKGQAYGSKISWNRSKEELLYLLDNLTDYFEDKAINKKGTVNPWFAFHFLINDRRISSTSEIYEARRAYKNTNQSESLKASIKFLDAIIQQLADI